MRTSGKVNIIALSAAASFNNWILGLFLNFHLFVKAGSVSEFSAVGQPHSYVFRALDVVSGLLIIFLAWQIFRRGINGKIGAALIIALAIFGLANAADALFPLACSETVSNACAIPVDVSVKHFSLPTHAYSSILIGAGYLLLPLLGYFYAKKQSFKHFKVISQIAVAVAMLSLVSILITYATSGSYSERAHGPSQEIQMLIMGYWLVALGNAIFGKAKNKLANDE